MLRLVTPLPIVFSVRTKDQGGKASSTDDGAYLDMVRLGLRSACEYVDLEMAWPASLLDTVRAQKSHSALIASWHDWTGKMAWDGSVVSAKHTQCEKYGDIVKIVGTARSLADNMTLATFAAAHSAGKPFLGINMGPHGQLSRILNPTLTPVTHAALPSRAAPGQLTALEINQGRHLMGLLPARQFYLFGSPIAHSVSPLLHNTGFGTLGLPYTYGRHETAEVDDELRRIVCALDFGGASVTIPLKLKVMDLLESVSEDARVIGAVNTIIPTPEGSHGDNTDWQAIRQAAQANLSCASADIVGLVVGAGGTCRAAIYALHKLGATAILLFNRTKANATSVAQSFPAEYNITVIDSLAGLPARPDVVISTVPGTSLRLDSESANGEGIVLPQEVLGAQGGVAIDLAYKPHKTALVRLAEQAEGWTAVTGVEILCLQGFKQFELWTGKRAPGRKMRDAVMAEYLKA
jgi:pentafunctional AROM polypeptide